MLYKLLDPLIKGHLQQNRSRNAVHGKQRYLLGITTNAWRPLFLPRRSAHTWQAGAKYTTAIPQAKPPHAEKTAAKNRPYLSQPLSPVLLLPATGRATEAREYEA